MAGTKRSFEFIAESRHSNNTCSKNIKNFEHSLIEIDDAIYHEEQELEQIEERNDLKGQGIEELAYPVIRLRSIRAKLAGAMKRMREFVSTREDQIDEFEDTLINAVQHEKDEELQEEVDKQDEEARRQYALSRNESDNSVGKPADARTA
jgi:hypothetical protein